MTSRQPTPAADSAIRPEVLPAPSSTTINDALSRIMNPVRESSPLIMKPRDRCVRPTPTYNQNYNPNQAPDPTWASNRRDELALYLEEAPFDHIPLMEYWRSREKDWPNLANMAFDFMAIPAMSSECKRVFSSCGMLKTATSSRLSGKLVWHSECLMVWQRRGAIDMGRFNNGILLI